MVSLTSRGHTNHDSNICRHRSTLSLVSFQPDSLFMSLIWTAFSTVKLMNLKYQLKILQHKTLWKVYLYSYYLWVIFACESHIHAVVKPASKVNRYFFSAGGRSFLDESHLGSFAYLVLILVEALLSVALKCTWITFHLTQLGFDLDHKRNSFSNRVWRGVYCN